MRLKEKMIRHRVVVFLTLFTFLVCGNTSFAVGQKGIGRARRPSQNEALAEEIFFIGMSHYDRREYNEATTAFQTALSLDRDNDTIREYLRLAQYYEGRQNFEDEISGETDARMLRKRIHDIYLLGQYALRYKRYEEAIEYFQKVLEMDPEHEGAWAKLAETRALLEKVRRKKPARFRRSLRGSYRAERTRRTGMLSSREARKRELVRAYIDDYNTQEPGVDRIQKRGFFLNGRAEEKKRERRRRLREELAKRKLREKEEKR